MHDNNLTPSDSTHVWRDLGQEALDHAYDQSRHASNMMTVIRRFSSVSESIRDAIAPPERHRYGNGIAESLNLHRAAVVNAPIHIFVHGGGWRGGTADDFAFPAETFTRAGAHYLAINFSSLSDTGGDLAVIADQVKRALAWIYTRAASFGGDKERIFISGHSSGAHLASLALTTDWQGEFGLPSNILKGGLLCSGMFDLEPVRLSSRGKDIALTDQLTRDLSAVHRIKHLQAPVIVAHGTMESPEFLRQSRDFTDAVQKASKTSELIIGADYNHFEIAETLGNPYGILGRAALTQMGLTGAR